MDTTHWTPHVPLASYTTFGVGGNARWYTAVTDTASLRSRVKEAKEAALPVVILAGGSNVLIADGGIDAAVIHLATEGVRYEVDGDAVRAYVAAGTTFDTFVLDTVTKGYWGLENLSAIPGSVGATPMQNVGAYGVEIADVLESVTVLDTDTGRVHTLSKDACELRYRDSLFKRGAGAAYIVLEVVFTLSRTPRPRLTYRDLSLYFKDTTPTQKEIRDAVCRIRAKKFPNWHQIGTAGSFFKNPIISSDHYHTLKDTYPELPAYRMNENRVKIPLGWILDQVCGLRGAKNGNVGTYEGQALVLVNYGDATAGEIDAFARMIASRVYETTGITIEREVTMLGTW